MRAPLPPIFVLALALLAPGCETSGARPGLAPVAAGGQEAGPVATADARLVGGRDAWAGDVGSAPADASPGLDAPADLDSTSRADGPPAPDVPTPPTDGDAGGDASGDAGGAEVPPLPWDDDPCATLDVGGDPFAALAAAFAADDDVAPPPPGGLVVVGSSTVRRWEHGLRLLSAWDPIQRGLGGARLADLARWAEPLVLRHAPAGVVAFAGTNDIAEGRPPAAVVDAWRCLATRLHASKPGAPLLWVGITPTPARWNVWPAASEVNDRVAALAALHPSLVYVDTTPDFLATGSPPDASLFADDRLHLSPAGYTLWGGLVRAAVQAHVPPATRVLPPPPPPGTLVRVDLGPVNAEDGRPAPATDAFGIRWNAWPGAVGSGQIFAGFAVRGLVSTQGDATPVELVVAGGFAANGLRNGGLTSPDAARLGTMAVPEATQDFFYTDGPDNPGGLSLGGLSPAATHTLRLFASRASADERRVTRFVVRGGGADAVRSVTTTGSGVGADGSDANVSELVVLTGLRPDARGRLHLDVEIAEGSYGYLNLLEIEVER